MTGLPVPWRVDITLDGLNSYAKDTMVEGLGIVFTEIGPNFLRGTMPVDERSCQPMGVLHGGASVAFAETLASTASNATMDDAHRCSGRRSTRTICARCRKASESRAQLTFCMPVLAVRSGPSRSITIADNSFASLASPWP